MLKFISKYLDTNLCKSSFAFALIYCVLFNSAIFIHKFEYYQAGILTAILELVKDFIYVTTTLFVFFFGLSIHRLVFLFGSLFLFATGAIASYYLFFFSISPTLSMMPAVFSTHPTELYELVSARVIVWLIFSIGVCLYSIKHFNVQATKIFFTRILSAACLLLVVMNIIAPSFSFFKSYFPMQYLHNSYIYLVGTPKKYAKEDISTKYTFIDSSDKDVVGVFVIGESARYDKFAINGYERDTTPNLSKMENLAVFKARSCASSTYFSVPCMLSRYGEKDLDKVDTETTMLSVLTKSGFDTVWFGTQSIAKFYKNKPGGSFYDEVNFHIVPGGSLVMLPNSHDEKMLPYLDQAFNDKKQFIVLHSTGSHFDYSKRYPKEFTKFEPNISGVLLQDVTSCNREELINSYDNSILYTDFFLSSVIDRLKDKNAFMIYSSDHGESLGENGYFTHSAEEYVKEQREVPLMIWMSDSYKKSHPEKWAAVEAAKSNEVSHDNIFHSILDCLGIESEMIDKSQSLCRVGS